MYILCILEFIFISSFFYVEMLPLAVVPVTASLIHVPLPFLMTAGVVNFFCGPGFSYGQLLPL